MNKEVKIDKREKKKLESILKNAGVSKGAEVIFVRGKKNKILSYSPFSTYYNDAFDTDSHNEEKAYILNKNGKTLCSVTGGYSARYSDGSYGSGEGETVRHALRGLGNRTQSAKYVLVSGRTEKQDNQAYVIKTELYESRGVVIENKIKYTLYEL